MDNVKSMPGALVGRTNEQHVFTRAITRGRARATLVHVEAEAGFGKSALIEDALRHAEAGGAVVHLARAVPFEADRPFGPLVDALGLHQAVAHADLAAGQGSAGLFGLAADARYRFIDLICARVEQEASGNPVVVVIEDLHYSDDSTPKALQALRRRLTAYPVLIVVSARPIAVEERTQQALVDLAEVADHRIVLGAMAAHELDDLACRAIGVSRLGPRLTEHIHQADGSPLMALELVGDLTSGDGLVIADDTAELVAADGAVPLATMAASTERRLSRLSTGADAMIRVGAVLGTAFRSNDTAAVLGVSADVAERLERELAAAGFLIGAADDLRFRHDLVRTAVLSLIAPSERSRLHAAAAERLANTDAPAAVVAAHWEATGNARPTVLAEWLVKAGNEASLRSPTTAYRLYTRALDLLGSDDPTWSAVALARLGMAVSAGLCDEAEVHGAELLQRDLDPATALRTRWWLGGVRFLRNQVADAAQFYEDAAVGFADVPDGARCLAMSAISRVLAFEPGVGPHVERALAAADAVGDPVARTVAFMARSCLVGFQGRYLESEAAGRQAIEIANSDPTGEAHRYQPHFVHAIALVDLGRMDDAMVTIEAGQQRCQETGTEWAAAMYHAVAAVSLLYRGRLDDAQAQAEAGRAICEEAGVSVASVWCYAVQALVALFHGDDEAAAEAISAGKKEIGAGTGQVGYDLLALAEARVLLRAERLDEARTALRGIMDFSELIGVPATGFCVLGDLVALAARLDDHDTLAAVRAFCVRAQHTDPIPLPAWTVDAVDAVLDGRDPGGALFGAHVLEAVYVDLAVASRLLAAGDRAAAERLVRRGERVLAECGAIGELRRAREAMPDVARRGRPPRRHTHGWDSLTATERYVVARLSEGDSNRAIAERSGMSTRTVETHVSRVLRKLSLVSRVEVANLHRAKSAV